MAMTQQEFEQWIEQQGGPKRVQYKRSTQKVANPAKQRTLSDGSDNPDWDPTAPATIEISEETWVAVDTDGKPTGAELHARRRPDGELDIVDQANANPAKPQGEANTPEKKNAAELQRQREKNAALPGPNPNGATEEERRGQDPAYETDEDRRTRAEARIKQQGADAEAGRQRSRQDEADQRARDDQAAQRKREEEATAERNKPKPVQVNGKWGYWKGEEWVPIVGGPADAQKPVQVEGQWGVWQPGEGGVPTWKPVEGPKTPVVELPALRLEAGKISEELKSLWEDLNARVRRREITEKQATDEFNARHAVAAARLAEIKQVVETQRGLYSDQLTQRSQDLQETQSRRGAATSAANAATDWLQSVAGKPGGGKADYSAAADEIIGRAYRTQQRYGATRETPAVQMGPAAAAANALPLPGLPSPSAPMATAGAATSELAQPGDPTLAGNAAASAAVAGPGAQATPAGAPPVRDDWRTNPGAAPTPPAVPGTPSRLGDTGAPPLGAAQGDSMSAASTILTPSASAGGGGPMMAKTMARPDDTPPALASLLEMELPGGIKVRVPSGGGSQRPVSAGAGSSEAPLNGGDSGGDDDSDRIKRMRDIAPDDPNWQRSLDEQERRYGRPTPQSMFAA